MQNYPANPISSLAGKQRASVAVDFSSNVANFVTAFNSPLVRPYLKSSSVDLTYSLNTITFNQSNFNFKSLMFHYRPNYNSQDDLATIDTFLEACTLSAYLFNPRTSQAVTFGASVAGFQRTVDNAVQYK